SPTTAAGTTLTVPPGARLRFASGASLNVNGFLKVEGTAVAPVLFTASAGTTRGYWNGVNLYGGGAQISDATFEYASWGIYANPYYSSSQQVALDNVTVHDSYYNGVRIDGAGTLSLANTTIRGSDGHGVYAPSASMAVTATDSSVLANGGTGLAVW